MTDKEINQLKELKNKLESKLAEVAVAEDFCEQRIKFNGEMLKNNADDEGAEELANNPVFSMFATMLSNMVMKMSEKTMEHIKNLKMVLKNLTKKMMLRVCFVF